VVQELAKEGATGGESLWEKEEVSSFEFVV